jgi:hypothetical protein
MSDRPDVTEYIRWLAGILEQVKQNGFEEYWDTVVLQHDNGKAYEINVTIEEVS